MAKNYWMVVQTPEEFEITKELGFTVHGLKKQQRRRAQRMEPNDNMLFYVRGIRKWTATAVVTSKYYEDTTPIWTSRNGEETYPHRVKIRPHIVMDDDSYIDAMLLAPRLDYLKRWPPDIWPLAFMDTLHLLPQKDFRLVESEMKRIHPDWQNKPRRRVRNRRGQDAAENGEQDSGGVQAKAAGDESRTVPA